MANNFPYFFQNSGASYTKASSTPFQLGIFDIDDINLTSSQMSSLHDQGKTIYSYVSVGEAVTYRDYWNGDVWSSDLIVSKNPNWDSYTVKFWDPRWKTIVKDQVEDIVKAGYDGMYMDVVDVYDVGAVKNAYNGSTSTQAEMIKFVQELSSFAKGMNPDFKLIANNAQYLLADQNYLKAIDGVGNEELYYSSSNKRVDWTEGNLALLKYALDAGKLVLDIDYAKSDTAQEDFIKMAIADGIVPFIGNTALNGVIDSTNYKINDILSDDWLKLLHGNGGGTNPDPDPTPDPDAINGTSNADALNGTLAGDVMNGNGGNDTVKGGSGNDTVSGGEGNDQLWGDNGNDRLNGDNGADYMKGGKGADTISGGSGNDTIFGNEDNDRINGDAGNDRLKGDGGNDTFVFTAGTGKDVVVDFTNPGSATGDVIAISSSIYSTVQQVMSHVTYSGGNALIDLGGGNSVQLLGVAANTLTAADFMIV